MPDKPVPDNDPIVTKSYAAHYMIATVILMATLLWALWDEAFGMRPWKAYQHVWKERYTAFLKTARSKSDASEREIEQNPDYQKLKEIVDQATRQATPRVRELQKQIGDLNAKILAVQSVFNLDVPMIMGTVLFSGTLVVTANLCVDLLYRWIDPRIKAAV